MKLLLFFLISISLWSADIDSRLYDGNSTVEYYEEIAKLIDKEQVQDENKTDADTERIATEHMILGKLKDMLSFTPKIDTLPDSLLPADQNVSTKNYLSYFNALTDAYVIMDGKKKAQSNIQSKLLYLTKTIDDITSEERKNLRLYQLQYAFYKLESKNNELSIKAYETLVEKGTNHFTESLKQVIFDIPALQKELIDLNSKLSKIEQEAIALNLAKERELMHHEVLSEALSEKLRINTTATVDTLSIKINKTLLLSLAFLQAGETDKMLNLFNTIKSDIKTLPPELLDQFTFKHSIIKTLVTKEAGNVSVVLSDVGQSAETFYQYSYKKFTNPLFIINEQPISTLNILQVILILGLGFAFASLYKRKIMELANKRENFQQSSAKMISNVGYYILVLTTLLIALNSIGLDLSKLGLIAGALSIGIGFGLQTIVSNLAAGIILMFERSIRIGDYIEISDTIRGQVSDMRMRSTTITTNDNIDVIIPNSSFIQNHVINWTLENDIRRIHIPFSVAYGTSNEKVEEVILQELKNSTLSYVKTSRKYATAVWMTAMGASSVDYELLVWIKGQATLKPASTKSDFLKFVYQVLNKHQIEIPFPQLDVRFKRSKPKKYDEEI